MPHLRWFRGLSLIGLLLLLLFGSPARAALILQDAGSHGSQIQHHSLIGQTFTAEDAKIASIGFGFWDYNHIYDNGETFVHLYEGVGDAGALLHTSSLILPPGTSSGFDDFDFSPVTLNVGSLYTAIVTRPNARWGLQHAGSDLYAGGNMISEGVVLTDDDLRFRVIPSAVPVPAAVWLFGTALVGLFGFSKRRKTT